MKKYQDLAWEMLKEENKNKDCICVCGNTVDDIKEDEEQPKRDRDSKQNKNNADVSSRLLSEGLELWDLAVKLDLIQCTVINGYPEDFSK